AWKGRRDRLTGGARLREVGGAGIVDESEESVDQRSIPLLAGTLRKGADRLLARAASPVRTVARHRHEGVGDGDDAGEQRNLIAAETVGIAGTINPLVVMTDGRK